VKDSSPRGWQANKRARRAAASNASVLDSAAPKERNRMKRSAVFLILATLACGLAVRGHAQQQAAIAKTNLKVGEAAPDFTLLDSQWQKVRLSDYRGKKTVILAFYVLAFTSG
jgi:AhpC/TSA family